TPTLLRSYICYHQTRTTARGTPVSAHQVADLVSAVRTFCRWLQAEGIVGRDLFARVPVPARPRLVKPVLTPAQIEQLLATVRRQRRNALRDEAILLLLLDTGIRASELCGLRPEHIDWTSRVARVFGKGQKERYVPFSTITA